ncbi:MAG: 1-phosphofructokinase family hexose kinase [Ruminococcaceae bacterium]|nr:1-phosphofructokinase family hexose kinase [Oscillospiraceae bacterium]
MKIITLTLNPAFDVHCMMNRLELYKENYGTQLTRQAAGKGINLSRALVSYGVENTAITVVGTENGEEFLKDLEEAGISYLSVEAQGRIRENLTVHSPDTPETRISFEGFQTDDGILHQMKNLMPCDADTIVTFTGRIPMGISKQGVISFLKEIKETGAKLVIDCNSFTMDELLSLQPMMIKPNQQEISQLVGKELEPEQAFELAKQICEKGIDHVLISFGGKGMVYSGIWGQYRILVPEEEIVSTVGAGDSTVAGFLAGLVSEFPPCDVLRLSAAFGSAACLTPGTNPPVKTEIDNMFTKIRCNY